MIQLATSTGVLILAIIAVSGIAIFTNFDTLYPASDTKVSTAGHSALMVSNVEVIKRDGAGNIVAYRQGSNHIVLGGMELIARQVFGTGGGNNTNSSGLDGTSRNYGGGLVRFMSIGNGSDGGDCTTVGGGVNLGFDNMTLECPLFDLPAICNREVALITRFNATEDPTPAMSDAAQINITAVATFSGAAPNSCAADGIGEAGIWNTLAGGPDFHTTGPVAGNLMFARNSFGTVNLSLSDSLELTWRFTFTDS